MADCVRSFTTCPTSPTILEAAGIAFPSSVNGIEQKPIEGVSTAYTFNDAKAADTRKAQVFEMFVYQDGWFASSLSFEPWDAVRGEFDPHTAKWE